MRQHEEYCTTINKSVYNKIHKMLNAGCDRCRWHRGHNRYPRQIRSWKEYRETQYRTI